jgi:hypothetical protein
VGGLCGVVWATGCSVDMEPELNFGAYKGDSPMSSFQIDGLFLMYADSS